MNELQARVNDFLRELTALSQRHDMWVEGEEMIIIKDDNTVIANGYEYDHDFHGLVANVILK